MPLARAAVAAAVLALPLSLAVVPPSHAVDMAHITGTVTTMTGGSVQPLAGIYVEAYLWDGTGTTFVSTDTTEVDGTYDMGDLPAGTYRVKFADYVGDVYPDEWHEDAATAAEGDSVTVAEDATVVVDARLQPGGTIGGTVTDVDSDEPVEGITVEVNRLLGDEWVAQTSPITGADGYFESALLAPGTYRVGYLDYANSDYVTEYWNDAPGVELGDDVVVLAGQKADADAELSKNSSVSGTVTAPGGAPLAGISIAMYDGAGAQVGSGATGADGQFKLVDVEAGSYRFGLSDPTGTYLPEYYDDAATLAAAQVVPVGVKTAVSGVDADLLLAPVPVESVVAPRVAGTARVGRTVAVTPGTWDPSAVSLSYRWRADGVLVPGATARTLKIPSKLLGKRLTASVTATAEGSLPATVLSAQTATVARGSLAPCSARLVRPRSVRPGVRVSVKVTGCAGARRTVAWRLSGKVVPGSRGRASTFTPRRGEERRVLTVVVRATRTGYASYSRSLSAGRIGS